MRTLKDAIESAGGCQAVAKAMGVSRIAVYYWLQAGAVPVQRVPQFCKLTGMRPEAANPIIKQIKRAK